MLAFAHASAAKIEAQNGKAECAERFHGVIHNLVVHGAAEERMRMADQRGMRCVRLAFIQQSFQPACGPVQEEGFDSVGHISFYHREITWMSWRSLFWNPDPELVEG